MRVDLAVLADYATVTADQKLVIVGVFDVILAKTVPVRHSSMYVALRICSGAIDNGDHTVIIRLVDPDGKPVGPELKAEFTVQVPLDLDGEGALQLVMGIGNVELKEFGPYAVDILIDDRFEDTVALRLQESRPPIAPDDDR